MVPNVLFQNWKRRSTPHAREEPEEVRAKTLTPAMTRVLSSNRSATCSAKDRTSAASEALLILAKKGAEILNKGEAGSLASKGDAVSLRTFLLGVSQSRDSSLLAGRKHPESNGATGKRMRRNRAAMADAMPYVQHATAL